MTKSFTGRVQRMKDRQLERLYDWAMVRERYRVADIAQEEIELRQYADEQQQYGGCVDWDEQDRRAHAEELIDNVRREQ